MNLTKEQRKKLTELYPFLIPRNVFTDEIPENYDYDYIRGEGEIPFGWRRLFFMYCKKIRPILSEYNLLDNYRFNQLKEKYGTLRIYDNAAPAKIHILNSLYSCFANYICQRCGQFANFETSGWIESICENCYNKENINNYSDCTLYKLKIPSHYTCEYYDSKQNHFYKENYTYRYLKTEYIRIKDMSDEEFYQYLIE